MADSEHESGQEARKQEAGEGQGDQLARELQAIAEQRESEPEVETAAVREALRLNLEAALDDPDVFGDRESDRVKAELLARYLAGELPRDQAVKSEYARDTQERGVGERLVDGMDGIVAYLARLKANPAQPSLAVVDVYSAGGASREPSIDKGLVYSDDALIVCAALEGRDSTKMKPNDRETVIAAPADGYVVHESYSRMPPGPTNDTVTILPSESEEAVSLMRRTQLQLDRNR